MSKRGGKNRNKGASSYNSPTMRDKMRSKQGAFWQSAQLNSRLYMYYRNIITQMAMSRFRWINLPKTCDERYLEWVLTMEGCATVAFPSKMRGTFLSLKAADNGRPNMYGIASSWTAIGDNGTRFNCDRRNGVLIYDNETRFPIMDGIDLYANELTHLRMTKRLNRLHQQIPFILKGPQEKRQDMVDLFKQVAGGEPAILTTNGIDTIDYEALSTGVQYLGEELATDEVNVWNRIYTMLGITNSLFKAERMTEDEIRAQASPTTLIKMNSLEERRKAANLLNERFGEYLDGEIQVVWRQDNESENFNFQHNIETQLRALED